MNDQTRHKFYSQNLFLGGQAQHDIAQYNLTRDIIEKTASKWTTQHNTSCFHIMDINQYNTTQHNFSEMYIAISATYLVGLFT